MTPESRTVFNFLRSRAGKVAVAFMLVVMVSGALVGYYSRPLTFDADRWQKDKYSRSRMIASLLSKKPLNGMTEEQVYNALGSPDNYYIDKKTRFTHLVYWVDTNVIDDLWLDVHLHKGVVRDVTCWPD
jgi:hypothetical protein